MYSQRGFTLVEVLIAAGISVLLAAILISVAHAFVGWSQRASATVDALSALDRFEERIDAEAAGSWSVFVPASDVLGEPNGDGHEFDIATEDALRRPSFRAYRYDASASRIDEYVYGTPGSTPIPTGDITAHVTGFDATNG